MQQQLSRSFRLVILEIAMGVLVNVRVVQPHLIIIDPRKCIAYLSTTRPQRLDLGAVEHDARFEGLQDMIVPPRFGVGENVCHKRGTQKVAPLVDRNQWAGGLALMLFALLGGGSSQFSDFRHFKADFFLNDFQQRDIRSA